MLYKTNSQLFSSQGAFDRAVQHSDQLILKLAMDSSDPAVFCFDGVCYCVMTAFYIFYAIRDVVF